MDFQGSPRQVNALPILQEVFGVSKLYETHKVLVHRDIYPGARSGLKLNSRDVAVLIFFLSTGGVADIESTFINTGTTQIGHTSAGQVSLLRDLDKVISGELKLKEGFRFNIGRFISQAVFDGAIDGGGLPTSISDATNRMYYAEDKPKHHGGTWQFSLDQAFFDALITSLL